MTVLQRAEKLTDRLAAEAVRARLYWKYLLGLSLDDPVFDHTVLAEFRGKVAEAALEQVVLDALVERPVSAGLVKAGGKQRIDSTTYEVRLKNAPVRGCNTLLLMGAHGWSCRRRGGLQPGLRGRRSGRRGWRRGWRGRGRGARRRG